MSDSDRPDAVDDEITAGLRKIFDTIDPPPDDLDDRVLFALAEPHFDAELARIVADDLVGATARSAGRVRTVRFASTGLTVLVTIVATSSGARRLDGWLVPPGPAVVEVRSATGAPHTSVADEAGRFVVVDVPAGPVQLAVRRGPEVVVTLAVSL